MQHIEPRGHTLTHSVLHFLFSFIAACFHFIDSHQHILSISLRLPYLLNASMIIWCSTHFPLLRAFQILEAIVSLYIRLINTLPVILALGWTIQVSIPIRPFVCVGNGSRYTLRITSRWMTVHCSESAVIKSLTSSSWKVRCRLSW